MTSPKVTVADWDTDPNNNTDIAGISIAEGCPAANLNDSDRNIMAQVAAFIGGGSAVLADWFTTATNKFLTPATIRAVQTSTVLTDSAAVTVNLATGVKFTLTKSNSGTMTFSNATVGEYKIYITQDTTGSRGMTITAPGGVTIKYRGGFAGLTVTPGATDILLIEVVTSTLWLISIAKGYS